MMMSKPQLKIPLEQPQSIVTTIRQQQFTSGALQGIKSATQWVRYTPRQLCGFYIIIDPLARIFGNFAEPWNLLGTKRFSEYSNNDWVFPRSEGEIFSNSEERQVCGSVLHISQGLIANNG
jgi:alpha-amylase/alpha-mannosidase (GH57 family)